MLSSRDTPMDADGWALIIEDLRRLGLLIAGGANDLNAGAIDADQQAINDLSTALNAHEIDPDAHAALLALYLLRTDYTAPTTPFTVLATVNTVGGGLTLTASATTVISGYATTGSDTLTGFNTGTGIFTVPTTGLYLVTGYVNPSYGLGLTVYWTLQVQVNGTYKADFGAFATPILNSNGGSPAGTVSGSRWMTAGDTIKLTFVNNGNVAALADGAFTIARLA